MWGLDAVTVTLAGTTALDEVSLDIPAGQVTAVVGGDGAGKTTLLRTLVGQARPAAGTVRVPDLRQIGYQPAASGTWGALSVEENVQFVGRAYGMSTADLAERGDGLLERAGLLAARRRPAARLSGGMRQKLGFVLAVLPEPRLVLLDEPSTGVDPVSRVELWRLVAETAGAGAAVLMTTTYLDEAERAAQVLALDSGRTLGLGDAAQIIAAMPGTVCEITADADVDPGVRWRRGRRLRAWHPDGTPPPGRVLRPDLEDALIGHALSRATTQGEHVGASAGRVGAHVGGGSRG